MEQPRHREAAAADGGDGGGWSRDPPAGGRPVAAWNGSCGNPATPGPAEEEDEHDGPSPGPGRCRCRGAPPAPPSPAAPRRDSSCGLACRHRPSTAATPVVPPPHGLQEAEEAGAGRGGRRRQQRHRWTPREKETGCRREAKRHRLPRQKNSGDGAEPLSEPPGYRGLLTRWRRLLCSCCCLDARHVGWARAGAWSWARRLGQRARCGALRAARWLRAAAALFLRLLWMLCALLLLLLMLLLGGLRLCWRAGAAGVGRLGRGQRGARLLALLDAAVLRRTWGLLGESRTCRHLWDWLQRRRTPPWVPGGGWTSGQGAAEPAGAGGAAGDGEEVTRLLAMAEVPEEELNPFQVLGLEVTASDAELKKAYRRLAVLVHPDKNEHPRAEAAFKVLRAAWDMVSSPERRREYEIKRMAESELTRSMSEFLSRLQDDLKEAMNTMMCSKCQGKHKRFEMDRDPLSARYCAECGGLHPAEEGDFWAESSLLGLKITYLAMMDGKIYDITEWAGCQRVGIAPDTHRVPYHISFGTRGTGRQRSASKGSPTSAADLQDFFTRVFQGSSGPMPGGPFPAPPTPPGAAASPGVPPRAEGAAPKGDTKHKRRKKVRRPFQR